MFELKPQVIDLGNIRHEIDWQVVLRRAKLRILFVTDGRFDDTNSVYEHMNNARVGCTDFEVQRAHYSYNEAPLEIQSNPGPDEPHYTGFQFRSEKPDGGKLIDDYHVIFIFAVGFSDDLLDDAEATEIHRWMDAGGGVFATGDHATLGQRLASKIPRVGTMRKWTDADGVPPGGGVNRIDTNQPDPTNPGEVNGTVTISIGAESDAFPQSIDWLTQRRMRLSAFREIHYPHEILCHPSLGPIDVMPDHPHEGECVPPSEINMDAKVKYDDSNSAPYEYPTYDGHQESPRIIARGHNASQYKQAKGALNPKVFNMISVYDGHKSNAGRVVVDSTWHHWYGMNINGLAAAGGDNWEKIGRYFLNVARYLAPENVFRERCWWDVIAVQFEYPFNEEVLPFEDRINPLDSGRVLGDGLTRIWGNCGQVNFIIANICQLRPALCGILEKEIILPDDFPRPPVCLSCPPFDRIQAAVLGGIVQGTQPIRQNLKKVLLEGKRIDGKLSSDMIQKAALAGIEKALDQFTEEYVGSLKHSLEEWSNVSQK